MPQHRYRNKLTPIVWRHTVYSFSGSSPGIRPLVVWQSLAVVMLMNVAD